MFKYKLLIIVSIMAATTVGQSAYSKTSINHTPIYQKAICSDAKTRYCVKAKMTGRLWWIAFDPRKKLPIGATLVDNEACDHAKVGTNLRGAFTVTPKIKCKLA